LFTKSRVLTDLGSCGI